MLVAPNVEGVQPVALLDHLLRAGVYVAVVVDLRGVLPHDLAQVGDGGPALRSGRPGLDHVEDVLLELFLVEPNVNKRVLE